MVITAHPHHRGIRDTYNIGFVGKLDGTLQKANGELVVRLRRYPQTEIGVDILFI